MWKRRRWRIRSGLDLIGPTIIAYGTEEQKKRFIPKILSAEEIWCQGFSEPNAGSDLAGCRRKLAWKAITTWSTARKCGPVTAGSAIGASWLCAPIQTCPSTKGFTVLLVDMKSPGVEVRPLRQMTGESEFNELFFRDVRVPCGECSRQSE